MLVTSKLKFESNFDLPYTARLPESGTHIELLDGKRVIGEVDSTFIVLNGVPIKKKRKGVLRWAWIISEEPELLLWPDNTEYLIDGEIVATVHESDPPSSNPFDIFVEKSDYIEPFIELSFDSKHVTPLIAMSLLLVDVSKSFHS